MPRVTQHSDPVVAKLERLGLDVQYEPEAARYDAADGLYWFCAKNYVGQGDPLYAILSRLDFHPSGRVCETEGAEDVYTALSDGELDPEELLNWIQGRRSNPSKPRKRPCALCGQPTYVTVQGEPRCADCTTSTGEDAARHALAKNTSRRRKNPKLTALAGGLIYKCPYCKDAIRLEARPGGKCEDCGGPASAVAVWDGDDIENGHPVCAPCAKRWQEYEDPFKHEPGCDGESWARENPTKKPLAVGKRLVVGDKVVMVTQSHDRVGYTVVVMHGDDVQEQGTYAGRTEALKAATLTYETLKHQGRLNPGVLKRIAQRVRATQLKRRPVTDEYRLKELRSRIADNGWTASDIEVATAGLITGDRGWEGWQGDPLSALMTLAASLKNGPDTALLQELAAETAGQ